MAKLKIAKTKIMKKYLTEDDIRKVFTNPNSLRKAIKLWRTAEKRGEVR